MKKFLVIPFVACISMVLSLPANAQFRRSSNTMFVEAVNEELFKDRNPLYFIPSEKKAEHGLSVCRALDDGIKFNELVEYISSSLVDPDISRRDAKDIATYFGTVAGGAMTYYCPQYRQQVSTTDY